MAKEKNLKDKQLNKVSGGGVINLYKNEAFADFLDHGTLPEGVTEKKMLEDIHFVDHVFDKGYMTPDDKKRLIALGFEM